MEVFLKKQTIKPRQLFLLAILAFCVLIIGESVWVLIYLLAKHHFPAQPKSK
jgi:hypothetical protein